MASRLSYSTGFHSVAPIRHVERARIGCNWFLPCLLSESSANHGGLTTQASTVEGFYCGDHYARQRFAELCENNEAESKRKIGP